MTSQIWLLAITAGFIPIGVQASTHTLITAPDMQPPTLAVAPNDNVLKPGSTGSKVKDIQAMLALMGYYSGPVNGNYDQPTAAAVRQFQTAAGLSPDGVVGPVTWQRLLPSVVSLTEPTQTVATPPATTPETSSAETDKPANSRPIESATAPIPPATGGDLPTLRLEDSGPSVERLQTRLTELKLYSGPLDGVFGSQTEQAVEAFQNQLGLSVDGVVGPATWQQLLE